MKPRDRYIRDFRGPAAAVLVLAGLVIGIGFRFWKLGDASLWMDEAYSRWFSDQSFRYLWTVVPGFETHPPFYYSGLKLWRGLAGDSNLALRLPSALAGFLLLPGTWLTAREFGRAMGLEARGARLGAAVALAFVAASPVLIDMARQARPYALFQLAYLACLYAVIRLYRHGGSVKLWTGYFLSLELLLWLHPIGVVFGFCLFMALMLAGLSAPRRASWRGWFIGGHAAAGIAYLPVLLIAAHAAKTWGKSSWLILDARGVMATISQIVAAPVIPAIAAIPLLMLAAWRISETARGRRFAGLIIIWLAAGPVLLALMLSLVGPAVFLDRVLSPAVIPAALLFGWLAASCWPRWQAVAVILLVCGLSVSAATLFPRLNKEDWATLTHWIAVRQGDGDQVWTYPNVAALPLAYAASDQGVRLNIRQIPADYPALAYAGDHPFGTVPVVTATPEQLRTIVASADGVPVIWLVTRMEQQFDPSGALPAALAARRRVIASYSDGELNIRAYRRPTP